MKIRFFSLGTLLFGMPLWFGCHGNDDAVFSQSGNLEVKPDARLLDDLNQLSQGDQKDAASVAADVTYNLKVLSKSETELCNGTVQLQIMSDFKLKFPQAIVNCLSLSIDLAGILGARAGANRDPGSIGKMKHDGQVLSLEKVAGATFDPPRPMLLGPIVQDDEKYTNFEPRHTEHTLSATGQDGAPIEGKGSFDVKVIKYPTTYKHGDKISFDKVLHWEITSSFDSPAQYGLTFSKWTWYWNTRPIMIPGIIIEGSLKDFIDTPTVEMAAALTGELKFQLLVQDYNIK